MQLPNADELWSPPFFLPKPLLVLWVPLPGLCERLSPEGYFPGVLQEREQVDGPERKT